MAEPETTTDDVVDPIDAGDVAPESAPEAVHDDQPTDAQPRDEQGRFAPDDTPDTEPAETAEPDTAPSEAAPETPGPQPFAYTADGQEYVVEGATIDAEGRLTIPPEQIYQVSRLLSSGQHLSGGWARKEQGWQQQIAQAEQDAAAQLERANALVAQLEQIAGMSEDDRLNWAVGFQQQWPTLKAQAAQAEVEARHRADTERLKTLEDAERQRQLEPQIQSGLEQHMTALWHQDPRFRVLDQQDMTTIWQDLLANRNGLVTEHEGQPQFDLNVVQQRMAYAAQFRRQAAQTETKKAAAHKRNAAELADTQPPPTVQTKTGPAPTDQPVRRFTPSTDASPRDLADEVDAWFDQTEFV